MASIESSESASPIIFDSLPYFDKDRDENPVLAEQVAHVLAVETQQVSQEAPHPHMAPAFEIFSVRARSSLYTHPAPPFPLGWLDSGLTL